MFISGLNSGNESLDDEQVRSMNYKVLIVDDSKLARMAVSKAMNAKYPDWDRVEAPSAEAAMTLLKETGADIAVLDFNMPGRDGLALAEEFRETHPAMPVAVISANHQKEVVERARAVGATFLQKPLTEQALNEFLAEAAQRIKGRTT
jgi:DNA-binding NarL/FixJ family response regulator